MKIKISVTIITFNEELNIKRCLESIDGIGDEIIIVDSFSTDKTLAICQSFDTRIYQIPFVGHIQQKNNAVKKAKYPFILSLDADECISSELKTSILEIKKNCTAYAYKFNRYNNYWGKWIRYGGLYPDSKIRLWNRKFGKWGGTNPHDKVLLNKGIKFEKVNGDLLHFAYHSFEAYVKQQQYFAGIISYENYKKGKWYYMLKVLVSPIFAFLHFYILKLGFLEGKHGWQIATVYWKYTYWKYSKLIKLYFIKR